MEIITNPTPAVNYFKQLTMINTTTDKPLTPVQLKHAKKELKEKTQLKRVTELNDVELFQARELTTISWHLIEYLNDIVDELRNLGLIGKKHLILDYQAELLKLQEHFAGLPKNEAEFLERQKQQKRFEKAFKKLSTMKAKKLNQVIDFIERIK